MTTSQIGQEYPRAAANRRASLNQETLGGRAHTMLAKAPTFPKEATRLGQRHTSESHVDKVAALRHVSGECRAVDEEVKGCHGRLAALSQGVGCHGGEVGPGAIPAQHGGSAASYQASRSSKQQASECIQHGGDSTLAVHSSTADKDNNSA